MSKKQPVPPLAATYRAQAILRAVAAGRVRMVLGCEPDLFIDGLACCDQATAHSLHHLGLIRPARPGGVGDLVTATLTADGVDMIRVGPSAA